MFGEDKNDDARVQCSLQLEKASDKKGWLSLFTTVIWLSLG
ncbi:hypothetical protein CIPAW_03G197300 [Carya illinoinensis]|uniref:Uncharacterized protein n=1 Tax=Carya illinoinensis TaxID=32201 RepID=A0A8T1R5V6_CARIL|nr:hypothetical protein CIPAW_03G197300 [Carya illinoinensis]